MSSFVTMIVIISCFPKKKKGYNLLWEVYEEK